MAQTEKNILTIAYLNIRGQSSFTESKQKQVEAFAKFNKCDIVHLQEAHIEDDTFSNCEFISSSYNIIPNNSPSKYGTASLVRSELSPENIQFDQEGRVIVFDIGQFTTINMYLHSGTDATSRAGRERYCCEVLPQLLINSKVTGCGGGDLNCIVDKKDATHYPEAKFSKALQRLIKVKDWQDSYRSLYPNEITFSRYYENSRSSGATRIDRCYHFGDIKVIEAKYQPIAFSDHFGHIVCLEFPDIVSRAFCAKSRPSFRLTPEVIKDTTFQDWLEESMVSWESLRGYGLDTLVWWEKIVKPGIRKLGIKRSKQLNKEKRDFLNLLTLRQCYLSRKIQLGLTNYLSELKCVHMQIEKWYQKESEKIQLQSRVKEFQNSEKTTIYHHELHKRTIKRNAILKLQVGQDIIEGHNLCASHLEKSVEDLLLHPAGLDPHAQQVLLNEVVPVFTQKDNENFLKPPTMEKVQHVVNSSNLYAAPGTDGLPSLLYKSCWDVLGKPLTEVMLAVGEGQALQRSMRTSLMVFGSKPKKANSILPGDKRKISLLNSDFKVATGLDAELLKESATHTLSHLQLVAGEDRRIHHGINLARNAIYAAGKPGHQGCGILDTDLIAAFDFMCLDWVCMVLDKKGLDSRVISRFRNLYRDNVSVIVVNNIPGKSVKNIRLSLRQGDLPSMHLFSFGIDPILIYLEKRLRGILITSLPVHGPVLAGCLPLEAMEERFKVIGYADDVKPAITCMEEFKIVDRAMHMFEQASGCRLHRDPASKKCKFLPLARWRGTLEQSDIPCNYMSISDHLDMLGVELRATWLQTRKANGDEVQSRVEKTTRLWRSGKFMNLSLRSWSLNSYCLSKAWFKTHCVDLRHLDVNKINSSIKSWLYADQFPKPEEFVMFRPAS